jgi:autotransporter translocation and assembly factor TamB
LIALRVAGAIVGLMALIIGVSLLVLRSDWGSERLRRQIVSRVNHQIRGSLDIKRLSFGGDKVVVWDVALRDPQGELVAHVDRTEVDFAVLRLLRKEVRVTAVKIESPSLTLASDDDGSNLSRAIAPRKKTPVKPPQPRKKTAKEGWVVRLDRFDLTQGDVSTAVVKDDDTRAQKVHLAALTLLASVRYATGNGSLDLSLHLGAQSQLAPVGPLRLAAHLSRVGDVYRFDADGDLLGGTLKADGTVDAQRLADADGLLALDIPRQDLAGHAWGPIHIAAAAHPAAAPKLDARLAIPGVELTARDSGRDPAAIQGRLSLADLALTGRAIQALSGSEMPPLGGEGQIDFGVEKSHGVGLDGQIDGQIKGAFEKLRSGETVIAGLSFDGQVSRISSRPASATFGLALTSVSAGTSKLRDIALTAKLREQDLTVVFAVASPARVDLNLAGRFDDDRQGLALTHLGLNLPGDRWASDGTAHLRFDDKELSVSNFRLVSGAQMLAVDGSRRGEDIAGHLALTGLRLGQLPTALVDPALRLDGKLDVDVKAAGTTEKPEIAATLDLEQAQYQGFAHMDAKVKATLHDDQVDATLGVEAPFVSANAELKTSTDPLSPGAPIDVKLDVKHLDIAQVLRGAEMGPLGAGRVNLKLGLDGSADNPRLDLGVEAFDLAVGQPAARKATKEAKPIDLGHAHVHVAYADSAPKAELDFAAAHGGTLRVEAAAHLDLSYPHIKRRLILKKLPVRGKVVARNLDVAWIAQFNPQVESLGGQVNADARLAGTVGDPQVVGDVHWKNGEVVAKVQPPKSPSASRPAALPATSGH